MMTIGKNIVKLDAFMVFLIVLSLSTIVHIYALAGVPVSATQVIAGTVQDVGVLKEFKQLILKQ